MALGVCRPLLDPDSIPLPAPKLSFKRGRNFLLYNPKAFQTSGFGPPPTPPTGKHPMKSYYEVLTTPTADTPGTTVLLHFPDKRYFFGQLSEGTQRACTERGIRITYLTDIFLTGRIDWSNTGGLIGVILTLADGIASSNSALEIAAREKEERFKDSESNANGKKKHGMSYAVHDGQLIPQRGTLTIHGGRNLTHSLATARRFVFRKGTPVFTREYDSEGMAKTGGTETEDPCEQPTWSDSNIKVWAMPIKPSPGLQPPVSSQVRSMSPRKRSLDEFEENNSALDSIDARTRDQVIRQSVITDMFNSTWRLDALHETKLADVKMPAVMFVRNPVTKDLEQYKGPAPGSNEPLPDINVLVRQPWPGAAVEKIPHTTWCQESVSYIVRSHDIRGKFDPKKAQELNVRKGPDYAKLTRGESVESLDGKTVTPDMVLAPTRLGKGMAIIDLPTPAHVDDLVNRPEWNSAAATTSLEAFLWILGPGVGDHPRLHEFVARMSHCKHTVSSQDYCPNYLAMKSIATSTTRMGLLRPESYPTLVHDNVTLPQPGTTTSESARDTAKPIPLQPVAPGVIVDMEPQFALNYSAVEPHFDTGKVDQQMPRAIEQRMSTIRKRVKKPEFTQKLENFRKDLPGSDVEIITLGTGSSAPSKYRNVSATLLNVPGYGYYLLDCGENTLGQLKRVFEPEKLCEVLQNLRMIWISHLHADHHLGTASVIRAWFQENYPDGIPPTNDVEMDMSKILQEKRLFVVSEQMMTGWLEEYAAVENYGFGRVIPLSATPYLYQGNIRTQFTYRHCSADGSYPNHQLDNTKPSTTSLSFNDNSSPLSALLREATGLSDLLTTRVSHCRGAMAVSLVFPNGFKVSFSGDCRPSSGFATIGRGSTVLIHEATFQDDMAVSAIAKKHSTLSEALEVGRLMNARAILLTHFSQRYQKLARIEEGPNTSTSTRGESNPHVGQVGLDVPDVPDDEPEPTPSTNNGNRRNPFGDIKVTRRPRLSVPIVAAFDYMRLRVGDMPIAQAHAPAVEKLFDLLERAGAEEANERREAAKQIVENRQKAKKAKQAKHKQVSTNAAEMEIDRPVSAAAKTKSIWSASESESGWSTSGSDSEGERVKLRRKRRGSSRHGDN
ncbi:tRNA processing endoribonuclease Trz1 [Aspergillus sclerotioniger CBS 115572]|uniref:ribonuclease Z n=1 Tax=Aspergillus sclerotioniger CBS 115572 TaxID=1450535 RepID=A0A317X9Q9_9EURO|nr:tRNA processing endoribonuclease Trz1 [Aspergillus sclerotioniger CBS 115572]PWY95343.1 tRNA processing endoribonuclease Trz1 [Aspergillus sclerotioniger CBS 115572]